MPKLTRAIAITAAVGGILAGGVAPALAASGTDAHRWTVSGTDAHRWTSAPTGDTQEGTDFRRPR